MSTTKLSKQKKENSNAMETVIVAGKETEDWKDGGRGWIVCFSAALVQFVVMGIHNNFGILYIAFIREYQRSKALTGERWIMLFVRFSSTSRPSFQFCDVDTRGGGYSPI